MKKILVLSTILLLGFSSANANAEKNVTDELVMKIWTNEQTYDTSKEDKITNLAWTLQQENSPLSKQDSISNSAWSTQESEFNENFKIIACAADIESKDSVDYITRVIWEK